MKPAPTFASVADYGAHLYDVELWLPYVDAALDAHGMRDSRHGVTAGIGGTYPTMLHGDVVVKFFGCVPLWSEALAAESASYALVGADRRILAPRVLAVGQLYRDDEHPWPYIISTRTRGLAWEHATLSREDQLQVARDLGEQVSFIHALRPAGVPRQDPISPIVIAAAARHSALPTHLVTQVERYMHTLAPFDEVFVHGDLGHRHVFAHQGRLSGIIDWGDATVTDRHYEVLQVHRDMFQCDKELLRVFLDSAQWPETRDFSRQCLGLALYRQAIGLTQHLAMDAFEPLIGLVPLDDIATLDELAHEVFGL